MSRRVSLSYWDHALEADHQMRVIAFREEYKAVYPDLALLQASASGEARPLRVNPRTGRTYSTDGQRLRNMGLQRGWPDLYLPRPMRGYAALFIEMKRPGEKPRPEQLEVLARLNAVGNRATWADHWADAVNLIVDYLELPDMLRAERR